MQGFWLELPEVRRWALGWPAEASGFPGEVKAKGPADSKI